MTVCYRRSSYVFVLLADRGIVDLDSFFKGNIDVSHEPQIVGVSLLDGFALTLDRVQLTLLSTLDAKNWIPVSDIIEKFGCSTSQLSALAEHGFLLSDENLSAAEELRVRDERIDGLHWNPYQALAYQRSRWMDSGEDMETPSDLLDALDDYGQLLNVFGKPVSHFHQISSIGCIKLPKVNKDEGIFRTLLSRRTARYFRTDKSLPEEDLSTLLFYTFGYHGTFEVTDGYTVIQKTSPSGGSLHPVEAYPLVLDVEGISSGLYHYNVRDHSIDLLKEIDVTEGRKLAKHITAGQEYFHSANVLVILTARFDRSFWKYRNHQKVLRVVEMDAAHLSQTFHLIGTELGLGTFPTAAIVDEVIENILGLPILAEGAMMVVGCGYPVNEKMPGGFPFKARED